MAKRPYHCPIIPCIGTAINRLNHLSPKIGPKDQKPWDETTPTRLNSDYIVENVWRRNCVKL